MKRPNPLKLTTSDEPRIAAAYIRVSTDDQEASLDVQRAIIADYAVKNNLAIPAELWFFDEDVSGGKPIHQRPSGSKLLALATNRKQRTFDTVLIVRPDRAFRDHVDQETAIVLLIKAGCEIDAAKADMSRATAMQRAMLRVQAVFAQAERELTGERIREHNEDRHKNKLHSHGRPSLGLTVGETSNQPLRVVEADLKRAIRVFEIYAETGGNSRETARRLNTEGIRGRDGAAFTGHTVRTLVMGPHYRQMASYGGLLLAKPETIPVTIPPDLLETVNSILTAQYGHWCEIFQERKYAPACRTTYTGLVGCGCGSVMHSNARPGLESSRFRCSSKDKGSASCNGSSVHAPTVDYLIGAALEQALRDRLSGKRAISVPKQSAGPDVAAKRADLAERRARARALYVDGDSTREEYKADIERLDRLEAALPKETEPVVVSFLSVRNVEELLSNWTDLWIDDLYSLAKRNLLILGFGVPARGITIVKESPGKWEKCSTTVTITISAPRLSPNPITITHQGGFRYASSTYQNSWVTRLTDNEQANRRLEMNRAKYARYRAKKRARRLSGGEDTL
jgi:DNA invertase Pin-like site-specific DNA recombinase